MIRNLTRRGLVYGAVAAVALGGLVSVAVWLNVFQSHERIYRLVKQLPGFQDDCHVAWREDAPVNHGFDATKLDALRDILAARRTKALLVVRHNRIVYEWYEPGTDHDRLFHTASLAKALVGCSALLVALSDGRIGDLDAPAWEFIPDWKNNPRKADITIRHLATHCSGLEDALEPQRKQGEEEGWKGQYWRQRAQRFAISVQQTPVLRKPGTELEYSNPGLSALAVAVTSSLRGAPETTIKEVMRKRIMEPLQVPWDAWDISYGESYTWRGAELYVIGGGARLTARAAARVGQLMLQKGNWNGRQVLDPQWVEKATSNAGPSGLRRAEGQPAPGLGWWTNWGGEWPCLPRDAFAGAGRNHQLVLVVPSLDLVVVRFGQSLDDKSVKNVAKEYWDPVNAHLFQPLMAAVTEESKVTIRWAPPDTIQRMANGSDNWPLTWAADDHLYAAYGDGWGFVPKTSRKLSLGLARIAGIPPHLAGENVRSETAEQFGNGPRGKKASGMLSVGGVLYMWARNADNSRLASSRDLGKTWTWAPWRFETSFGCPTFLNFGKDYAGARDHYVYIYSPDSENAYVPSDRLVMARVPADRITKREAYEFFKALDESGQPQWTRNLDDRGAVFHSPGECFRSHFCFNPGIQKYLWVQPVGGSEIESPTGLAVYMATEPWGPWQCVYLADPWDTDPGESASFPTKWMSADGRTVYLVFSGHDAFNVRKATIDMVTTTPPASSSCRKDSSSTR